MAKSKNHTAHNQTYKAHRHSIKKPKKSKYSSRKGVSHGLQTKDGRLCRGTVAPDLGCQICACQRGSITELRACGLLTLLSCNSCLQMDPKFLRNQVSCGLLLAGSVLHVSRVIRMQ
jgi:large subunit ribosomal protein L29e